MKLIQLQYPDEAHNRKIIDDLTVLSRNTGQRGHRAVAAFDTEDEALAGVADSLIQRSVPTGATVPQGLSSTEAIVSDGDPIAITGGSVELTVEDGVITGGTYTPD
jgi:hypothetical protein